MSTMHKNILIVEDQLFFQEVLCSALKKSIPEAKNIECVNSGNNAIRSLKRYFNDIRVIFLDIKMEDGDGISVLNYMVEKELSHIPVYIVSSLDRDFIKFVMKSIANFDVRVVGFIPKETPNSIYERIELLKSDIVKYIFKPYYGVDKTGIDRHYIQKDIRSQIDDDLMLYVQPKVKLQTETIVGFEVLTRLCNDYDGIIEPNEFLPLLTTHLLNKHFNITVIKQSFSLQSELVSKGVITNLSINVDPWALECSAFVDEIKTLTEDFDFDLGSVTFELTELPGDYSSQLHLNIAKLKLMGFKLALDDFGKGFSNMDRLNDIPFDEIKLDRGLISELTRDKNSEELLQALIKFVLSRGSKVTAEGVENAQLAELLKVMGCDEAQGYYYSIPKPSSEIHVMYKNMFNQRISKLLGNIDRATFTTLYELFFNDFYKAIDDFVVEHHSHDIKQNFDDERKLFVHHIRGMMKTAGFYESIQHIDEYEKSNRLECLVILRESILYCQEMYSLK